MTLPSNSRVSTKYTANGTNKDFAYNFRVFYSSDTGTYGIEVRKVVEGGYEIVSPALYEVIPDDSTLIGGKIRYFTAPVAGTELYVAGKTPKVQQLNLANYGRFSAESIEANFDFMMAIIQEWLSSLDEERAQRIANDLLVNANTAALYAEWQSWAETNVPLFAETYLAAELADFKQAWIDALNEITLTSIPAVAVPTANTQNQQEVNDSIGAKWYSKIGGYNLHDRVTLLNGLEVRSTAPANTNNPNINMTGWVLTDLDSQIKTWSNRSQEDKNKEFVSDKDYGAIADGTYHPLSERYATLALAQFAYANIAAKITSLTDSIDWAAAQSSITANRQVWISGDFRIITKTIEVPPSHGFVGTKRTCTNAAGDYSPGSAFLFYGTGAKSWIAPSLGDNVYQTANPNVGSPYLADSGTRGNVYKLQNFNENFSVGVILSDGSYLEQIAVLPYHTVDGGVNPLSGYTAAAANNGKCADKWDVGVWARNAGYWRLNNVWGKGQWRKAGLLISASQVSYDGLTTVANDGWYVQNSVFAGGAGLSIRSDNAAIGGFTNYGFGNGSFVNCQFYGFNHVSNHLATSSYLTDPLDRPSAAIELNGIDNKPRGIDFTTCTIFGRDDINIFAGYANEIKFIGCYQESKGLRINGVWTADTEGSRMVVSADSSLQFVGHSKYGIDFTPNFQRDNGVTRYGATPGCFSTNSVSSDDDYEDYRYINSVGFKMRRNAGVWGIADYLNGVIFSVDADGDVVAAKSISAGGVLYMKGGLENTLNGSATVFKRANAGGTMDTFMWVSGSTTNITFYGTISPTTDNTYSLGVAGGRWSTVYAATGTINTSDSRLKEQFRTVNEREKAAALEIKNSIGIYKFKDAVEKKGDDARLHVGVLAQEVVSIMAAHDLDANKYGFLCYDEWDDEPAEVETWDDKIAHDDVYNDEGEIIHHAGDVVREAGSAIVKAAVVGGNRYGIRYEELILFIISAM